MGRGLSWRCAVGTAAAALTAVVPSAAAGSDAGVIAAFSAQRSPLDAPALGADWQGYAAPYALQRATAEVLTGQHVDMGACAFGDEVKLAPTDVLLATRERALNLVSCKMLVERGLPPASVLSSELAVPPPSGCQADPGTVEGTPGGDVTPTVDPGAAEGTSEPGDVVPPNAGAGADADARGDNQVDCGTGRSTLPVYHHSAGYFKSYWEDPAQIDVTSVSDTTDYYYGNGCVHHPLSNTDSVNWYSTSGWTLRAQNLRTGVNCGSTYASTYARMINDYFCRALVGPLIGRTTHNTYDRNSILGASDGSLTGRIATTARGGCTRLLTFHHFIHRNA